MRRSEEIEQAQKEIDRLALDIADLKAEQGKAFLSRSPGSVLLAVTTFLGPIAERERQREKWERRLAVLRPPKAGTTVKKKRGPESNMGRHRQIAAVVKP